MLAIGRRGQLDDNAIIRYMINGLEDEGLRKSLSAISYVKCSDLLKSLQNVVVGFRRQIHTPQTQVKQHYQNKIDRVNKDDNSVKPPSKSGPTCYNCREIGHISRNCPKPPRKPKEPVNVIANPNIITKSVKLNERMCNALIDSGSAVSLMKRSIAKELNCDVTQCEKLLKGFAGGEHKCVDKIKDIKVTIDEQCYVSEIYIVDDNTMTYEVIIGLDILSNGRVIIENGNCQVFGVNENKIQCDDNLKNGEKNEIMRLINRYSKCFSDNMNDLGKCGTVKMEISVTSPKPVVKKPYTIPIPKQQVVDRIVNELLDLEIIRPSSSLYASPIVLTPKANGEDRLCVDYRALNAVIEKQPWPMPTVDGVLATLSGKKYFTTLDMMSGYYQIEIEEDSKKYTAFITHNGHYEFNRMPFGLKNAPCMFQKVMMKI